MTKWIFWSLSAVCLYAIWNNWTPPIIDWLVASLVWWFVFTFVGAVILLTLAIWKWEIKFAAKAWYEGGDDHYEERPRRSRNNREMPR